MVSVVCTNKLLFAGGFVGLQGIRDDVNIYDPQTNLVSTAKLSLPRNAITATSLNDVAFFAGGETNLNNVLSPSSRIDIYDLQTNTWSIAELSIPRSGIASGAVGNKVFFAGGKLSSGNVSDRIDIYDMDSKTWSTTKLSEARSNILSAVIGNKILFVGGFTGSVYSNTADVFDLKTNSWSTTKLTYPLSFGDAAILKNKIYFTGGGSVVQVYDNLLNTFSTLTLSESKNNIAIGVSNDKIAFIGGTTGYNDDISKRIEVYDPATNAWSYLDMEYDLAGESILSYNNFIFSAGGAINSWAFTIPGIFKFSL
jgi:N-acetylneuraminic acid mutarotase